MELSPKFVVLQKLKGNKQNSAEKWVEISMKERANVATLLQKISSVAILCGKSFETMAMSQHQLDKGKH